MPLADESGWDDRIIDCYYQVIHPVLPILPSSKLRLRQRLLSCSNPILRYTLLCGVCGLVKKDTWSQKPVATGTASTPSTPLIEYKVQLLQGILQISSQENVSILDPQSKILYLMSMILLFLQTDDSMWLGAAINLAFEMRLHDQSNKSKSDEAHSDLMFPDSRASKRRLFLILVILDRLNATVKSVPIQIPESVIQLNYTTDSQCFTGRGVELVRLSIILGHASKYCEHFHSINTLRDQLDQAFQKIEPIWDTNPILKALYYLVMAHFDQLALSEGKNINNNNNSIDASALIVLLESPLISISPLISYMVPPLVNILLWSRRDEKIDKQLESLGSLIERKFPEFEYLRMTIAKARSATAGNAANYSPRPIRPVTSPQSRLEGLAHIAHVQAGLNRN